jgi:hypothetical protein
MQRYSPTEKLGQQALDLHRSRLICKLLREEGLLSDNANLVSRLADRLLRSYLYRALNQE